jgi:hypothetical protein
MSNDNFHHLPWPSRAGERHVNGVTPIGHGVGEWPDESDGMARPEGRIVRRRQVSAAEARAIVTEWTVRANRHPASPGWTAWERVRADGAGRPRVQRLALDEHDPATVVNWSVGGRPTPDDEAAWRAVFSTHADRNDPVPPRGDAHEWAA